MRVLGAERVQGANHAVDWLLVGLYIINDSLQMKNYVRQLDNESINFDEIDPKIFFVRFTGIMT